VKAEDWPRLGRLFEDALARPAGERGAFVESACAAEPELREQLLGLLASHADAEGKAFLEVPHAGALLEPEEAAPDRRIGDYLLVEEIGRGGMGVVFRAWREAEGRSAACALKLMRHGLHGDAMRARFLKEQRILASLQHPNIARLLDAGTTPRGSAVLAMELIDGRPITEYVESRGLSLRARLELFRSVLAGVAHAHERQVIHRDLKPSNILVTRDGVAKLLDFGIAKLLDTDDPHKASTVTSQGMMTPEYASPEQVKGEAVTAASDVYALGVVLCEVLTRRRPYRVERGAPDALARVVLYGEPERPSALAASEETGPRPAELQGALDRVVMKALAKQPGDRYASALLLDEDVARHLAGREVLAPRLSPTTRRRALRSPRPWRGAAALLAVTLLAAFGGWAWRARREQTRQGAERAAREERRALATELAQAEELLTALDSDAARRDAALRSVAATLDRLAPRAEDPVLRRRLAANYRRIAQSEAAAGRDLSRRENAAKALALLRRLEADDPSDASLARELRELDPLLAREAAR
jgi:non-specific serine/threonine protein kinase/serine/threonine-protein kinase